MEEIGCHFKFEKIFGNHYHDTDLLLSSGRNCLRYIIKERKILTLFLPYFLCESLSEVAISEKVNIIYYHIDDNFMPINIDSSVLNDSTYLYIVNYYGMFTRNIKKLVEFYNYVIIDNTHAFFDRDYLNADVIYNYRKYFGVPDGACIVSPDLNFNHKYLKGESRDKVMEMISRDETGDYFHYPTFAEADKYFRGEELRYMSNFTENYLHALNYNKIYEQRLNNYGILNESLSKYNRIDVPLQNITYMYPLYVSDGVELRKFLQDNNIYSLRLWANVDWNGANSTEIEKANNMVLLPIDQRYSDKEMEYISDTVNKYYSRKIIKSR